jgi:agmatine deiminase
MIADWDADTLFVSDLLKKKQPGLLASLRPALKGVPIKTIPGTADIWCRDYMPVQVDNKTFCQFAYSPDYLRGFENLITPPEKCRQPFMTSYCQEPIVLDGGNVVASRTKVILTEKVYKENPSIKRPLLRTRLEEVFRAECIFIPKEPYDPVGHADGVVRFVSEKRVLVNNYSGDNAGYGERVRRVLEKRGLEVETLPMFQEKRKCRRGEIESAVGLYINFLRVGDVVVLPGYGTPEDEQAVEKVKKVTPGTKVLQVPCRSLAEEGGVLNCVTWTVRMRR